MGADHDIKKKAERLIELTQLITVAGCESKMRIECYKEFLDDEIISEDIYERMVDNERLGLIEEIDNITFYFRKAH